MVVVGELKLMYLFNFEIYIQIEQRLQRENKVMIKRPRTKVCSKNRNMSKMPCRECNSLTVQRYSPPTGAADIGPTVE